MTQSTNDDLEKVRKYWNVLALQAPDGCKDHWVDEHANPLPESLFEEIAQYLSEQLPKSVGLDPKIFELGCGTGRILAALRDIYPDAKLWGIDLAEEQISQAQLRVPDANLSSQDMSEFINSSNQCFNGYYDMVFMHGVCQYFPSTSYFQKVLEDATSLVRSGGVLCLLDVPVDWYYEQMRGQPKRTLLTPIKEVVKRIIGYKPRDRQGVAAAVEVLNGKRIEVPTFSGYWASPEVIKMFAKKKYSIFRMEYQPFSSKPVIYKKYRPIFIMGGKRSGDGV